MHPPSPSDETSRPARRRALGRGPGTSPPTVPREPEAAWEAAPPTPDPPAAEPPPPALSPAPAARPEGPAGEAPAEESAECAHSAEEPTAGEASAGRADAVFTDPAGEATGAEEAGAAAEADDRGAAGGLEEAGAAGGPRDGGGGGDAGDGRFTVRLANFEGPFDLLLQLIAKHKLDVTEVALSRVTDEFMAHIRAMGPDWDLDQTTEFLVVAATLLDLKAARLLPAAEVEDEADLALLEARDLLFARLLQYRAYKRIADIFAERWEAEGRRHPRTVGLEPHHAELLPEVVISVGAEGFARLAVKAMQPKARPEVYVDHIHAPLVSVREQAAVVVALLREKGTVTFRELVAGVDDTLTVVARFLALLELYREKAVALDQETALGDLTVSWTGGEADPSGAVTDEFDQEDAP
ncbi:segregation and condensation protein A [Streptomyces roseicoloratus]|uniref:segregation and condensation protein A n=1 Tax=Streptomyces roseicoloratus TaxID=2508722 RepID=UPI0010098ECB|nr:segregation/condensation protein A [Streptomyces roseicoloratus]